jgi:hypothetical protein
MPFKSEAQRRFLWMHHPEIAKRWSKEFPHQKGLPYHEVKKSFDMARKKRKKKV